MKKTILTVAAVLCFASATFPQDTKNEPKPKGLTIVYDKFRETTLVRTDRVTIHFGSIKLRCEVTFGYVKSADTPVSRLFMAATQHTSSSFCPLDPDTDVILLVGGQRYKLGKMTKVVGLYPINEYEGGVMVEIPLEVLEAIASADKWEMAVGGSEAKVKDWATKELRGRLPSLITQFKKDSAEPAKP